MTNKALVEFLQQEGFQGEHCGGMCPVELEAFHQEGLYIYLKARGRKASLDVYDEIPLDNGLPKSAPVLTSKIEAWRSPDAGYLSEDEVFAVFYALWSDAKNKLF